MNILQELQSDINQLKSTSCTDLRINIIEKIHNTIDSIYCFKNNLSASEIKFNKEVEKLQNEFYNIQSKIIKDLL